MLWYDADKKLLQANPSQGSAGFGDRELGGKLYGSVRDIALMGKTISL